jgi:peptidoglycan/xylan/chitin deacetylase (PgdA/CDA1 family)
MKTKVKLFALFLFRLSGLFMLSRRLTRKQIRILCYHGGCLGDEGAFNQKLFLSAETLRSRIQWLRRHNFNIVSLDQAADSLEPGAPHAPLSTVITFDDGWFSTGTKLLPVLTELGLPSTLYLCTEHVIEGWPVVPVTVRYILWKAQVEHANIVGIDERVDGQYDLRNRAVREALAVDLAEAIERQATDAEKVYDIFERLAACVGIVPGTLDLRDRRFAYLNPAELRQVADSGCSIELHGHRHRYPVGDPARFERDLKQCRDVIVTAGLPEPRHYCYPSGTFDAAATKVLSGMAIRTGTTCKPGLVTPNNPANKHYLPRFLDGGDVHMLEFEAEMSGFSALMRRALGKAA